MVADVKVPGGIHVLTDAQHVKSLVGPLWRRASANGCAPAEIEGADEGEEMGSGMEESVDASGEEGDEAEEEGEEDQSIDAEQPWCQEEEEEQQSEDSEQGEEAVYPFCAADNGCLACGSHALHCQAASRMLAIWQAVGFGQGSLHVTSMSASSVVPAPVHLLYERQESQMPCCTCTTLMYTNSCRAADDPHVHFPTCYADSLATPPLCMTRLRFADWEEFEQEVESKVTCYLSKASGKHVRFCCAVVPLIGPLAYTGTHGSCQGAWCLACMHLTAHPTVACNAFHALHN